MVRLSNRYANMEVETDFKDTKIKTSNDIIEIYKDDISKKLKEINSRFNPVEEELSSIKDLNNMAAYKEVKELYKEVYKEFMNSEIVTGLQDKEQVRQIIKAIEALENQKLEMICKFVIAIFTTKMKMLAKNSSSMKERELERELNESRFKMGEILGQLERENKLRMETQSMLRQSQDMNINMTNMLNRIKSYTMGI